MMPHRSLLLALLLAGCGKPPEPATANTSPTSTVATSSQSGAATPPPAAAAADLTEVEAAIKANDGPKARQLADEAVAKNPKNAKAHYYAGVGAELSNDRESAERHYRDALGLVPGFSDAAVNLSAILLDTKRAADAVSLLKPFAAKAPDDPLIQSNFATALAASGDHEQAASVYSKLIKKDSAPELRLGYAASLIAAGKKDDAAKTLREGEAQAGDNRDLHAAFGRALAQAGAFDDAIKALDQALKIKPGADLFTYRALFKRSAKNNDGARADLEAAIKDNPKFTPAYRYLGEVLEDLKKPGDAKKAYQKAVELEPGSAHGKKAQERLDALKKK